MGEVVNSHTRTRAALTCKGWLQEAAFRMIQNDLDPEVAKRLDDLVAYGGRGHAAQAGRK